MGPFGLGLVLAFIAGLVSLLGLVSIAWTASFTYFEMMLYRECTPHSRRLVRRMGDRPSPTPHERIDE